MAKDWIRKIRKGMILRYPNGYTDIVIETGYLKGNRFRSKGCHYIMHRNNMTWGLDWQEIEEPEILGYADKRDMRRINRMNKILKDLKRKGLL